MGPQGRVIGTGKLVELDEKPIPEFIRCLSSKNRVGHTPIACPSCRDTMAAVESPVAGSAWLLGARGPVRRCREVGSIKVILAGNADEGEEGVAPGIGLNPQASSSSTRTVEAPECACESGNRKSFRISRVPLTKPPRHRVPGKKRSCANSPAIR